MGRAKKIKELRKIARKIPAITSGAYAKEILTGGQLFEKGIKTVEGKPVVGGKEYVQNIPVRIPVNHHRNLKKEFFKNGKAGVMGYLHSVEHFIKSQNNDNKESAPESSDTTGSGENGPEDQQADQPVSTEQPSADN